MSWKAVFLIALAVGQVPAKSTKHVEVEYVKNYVSRDGRIVSGWEAEAGQHPHHAALRMVSSTGGVSSCGGSVVHRNWVITAAHCTAQRVTVVVRAGVVHITTPQYISETTEWYNHPTFNDFMASVVQPNDIAILKLTRPVTYTNELKAIRIQNRLDANRNYDRQVLQASGHGRTWTNGATTEVLNWVYLRGISNAACFSVFGSIITSATICAQFYNVTSQSTCQGDSGGPLVHVDANGERTLVGVTSFVAGGTHGCHSGLPAGFIRPGSFHAWFTQVTGIDFENLVEEEEPPVTEPEPEEEVTETPEPEEEVTETPEPEEEVTETPEPEEEVTETPKPEDESTEAPESEEDEDDDDSGSSESEEDDPEMSELLKRLEVKFKVKVKMSKYGKHKEIHHHTNKTISHHRRS